VKLIGTLAITALLGLTIYYTIPVFNSTPEATPAVQAQPSNHDTASFGEIGTMPLRNDTMKRTVIDPQKCVANVAGVTTAKLETVCTVTVDLHLYPIVRGMAGFCKDFDTTSPENTASKLVFAFKGKESLFLVLFTEALEVEPGVFEDTPPVNISGIGDENEGVDWTSLPADPN